MVKIYTLIAWYDNFFRLLVLQDDQLKKLTNSTQFQHIQNQFLLVICPKKKRFVSGYRTDPIFYLRTRNFLQRMNPSAIL